jgi:hypothetical protein
MTQKRKNISKRVRFEVFKRDTFKCQYCGAHPPAALLHVDHIVAVANGGLNDMDNLVTSCDSCNLGKGAVSLNVVPKSLADKAREVSEREEQLAGYHAILEARRDRIEDELWRVAEVIESGSSERGMNRKWTSSIRMFNERLGVYEVLAAAEIARAKFHYGGNRAFRYFCGICWKKIKGE